MNVTQSMKPGGNRVLGGGNGKCKGPEEEGQCCTAEKVQFGQMMFLILGCTLPRELKNVLFSRII